MFPDIVNSFSVMLEAMDDILVFPLSHSTVVHQDSIPVYLNFSHYNIIVVERIRIFLQANIHKLSKDISLKVFGSLLPVP